MDFRGRKVTSPGPVKRIKGRKGEKHFPRKGRQKAPSNSLLNKLAGSNYK